jgi:hypothetical protein
MIISPFWGGAGYKQLRPGSVDLYLKHDFTLERFEDPSSLKAGTNANQFIVDTMREHPNLMFIALLTPYNFNARSLIDDYLSPNQLKGVVVSPHQIPPSDIDAKTLHPFQGDHHRLVSATDVEHWKHFRKYTGPDRFVLVFREEELVAKLDRLKGHDRLKSLSQICTKCNKAIKFDDTVQLSGGWFNRLKAAKKAKNTKKGASKPSGWAQMDTYDKDEYMEEEFDLNAQESADYQAELQELREEERREAEEEQDEDPDREEDDARRQEEDERRQERYGEGEDGYTHEQTEAYENGQDYNAKYDEYMGEVHGYGEGDAPIKDSDFGYLGR